MSGAIWNNVLPDKLEKYLPESAKSKAQAIYKSMVVAKKFAIGSPVRDAINKSYRETQQILAIAATAALAPMLIVMLFMKPVDLQKRDEEDRAHEESASDVDPALVGKGAASNLAVQEK